MMTDGCTASVSKKEIVYHMSVTTRKRVVLSKQKFFMQIELREKNRSEIIVQENELGNLASMVCESENECESVSLTVIKTSTFSGE